MHISWYASRGCEARIYKEFEGNFQFDFGSSLIDL